MLQRMKRGYTVRQVRQALESLCRSKAPFGASLMFGAPGETPETVAETLDVMKDFETIAGLARGVGPENASRILATLTEGDAFYREILKAERSFIQTHRYWA